MLKHEMVLFIATRVDPVLKDEFNGRLVGGIDTDTHTPSIFNAGMN